MEHYRTLAPLPPDVQTAVAMGFFDGLHQGHRRVMDAAVAYAARSGLSPAVFTFELPVSSRMKGKRLMTRGQKYSKIEAMGIAHYLDPNFDEFSGFTPADFVADMLARMYRAKAVFCGENFTFGRRAAGSVDTLRQLCAPLDIHVEILPMAEYEGAPISSTRIRRALEAGEIEQANAMLGSPYEIVFPVLHGHRLGRRLGMPTINQHYPEGFQLPRLGVYVTRAFLGGQWWPSATGLGARPTVNDNPELVSCETFIPGYDGDLYGTEVPLQFLHYLEPSRKFDDVEQLRRAVMSWAETALAYQQAGGAQV